MRLRYSWMSRGESERILFVSFLETESESQCIAPEYYSSEPNACILPLDATSTIAESAGTKISIAATPPESAFGESTARVEAVQARFRHVLLVQGQKSPLD